MSWQSRTTARAWRVGHSLAALGDGSRWWWPDSARSGSAAGATAVSSAPAVGEIGHLHHLEDPDGAQVQANGHSVEWGHGANLLGRSFGHDQSSWSRDLSGGPQLPRCVVLRRGTVTRFREEPTPYSAEFASIERVYREVPLRA
jgi:hypothetical protein